MPQNTGGHSARSFGRMLSLTSLSVNLGTAWVTALMDPPWWEVAECRGQQLTEARTGIQILLHCFVTCGTSGSLHNLSELQVFHLENGDDNNRLIMMTVS